MKVLVTGASGFVGGAVRRKLASFPDIQAVGCLRSPTQCADEFGALVRVGDLSESTDWSSALTGVEVVVHAAARVHVMRDVAASALAEFRRVNVEGSLHLARQAVTAGVRRFVFISSVKVHGELTQPGRPFRADDALAPMDAYGVSKMEAEQGLLKLAVQTGMELVIIRPPLVYGPGVKANFRSMVRWLRLGLPLPLGAINNLRSLVSIHNLVDLTVTCIQHPAAANQAFLVSDGEDLSTPQLLVRMGRALGRPVRLVSVSPALLNAAASLAGHASLSRRLCESLQVDISKAQLLLGWYPPVSVDEELKRVAEDYWREATV